MAPHADLGPLSAGTRNFRRTYLLRYDVARPRALHHALRGPGARAARRRGRRRGAPPPPAPGPPVARGVTVGERRVPDGAPGVVAWLAAQREAARERTVRFQYEGQLFDATLGAAG